LSNNAEVERLKTDVSARDAFWVERDALLEERA
jgi:hypothetical protein